MKRLASYAIAIVVLATTALLATNGRTINLSESSEAQFAADGAFRDGLHLGRFAAEQGQPSRACSGRWSAKQDRSMFTAGYQRGYSESLARAETISQRAQPAE